MLRYKSLWMLLLVLCLILISISAGVGAIASTELTLVLVDVPDDSALTRLANNEWPVYAWLHTADGVQAVAAKPSHEAMPQAEGGLLVRMLDDEVRDKSYYLATYPGRERAVRWSTYGRVLYDSGKQIIIETSPRQAEHLAQGGAEIQLISLTPKPIPSTLSTTFSPTILTADPLISTMMEQVSADTVNNYVGNLSGEWPVEIGGSPDTIYSRHTANTPELAKAIQYVGEHLDSLGQDVTNDSWSMSGYSSQNVIGEISGQANPDDIYLITGHLDDMPSGPLAPGADDNASGSAAVLIAADILSQYSWDCTLRFVLWTGEEQGLLGSSVYAQEADAAGENILGVLNMDMLAWNTADSSREMELHARATVAGSLEIAQLFNDVVSEYSVDLNPEIFPNGTTYSDHASFWDYDMPAILVIEDYGGDFNPYYHSTNDLVERFDMEYYTEMIKASLGTFVHLTDCLLPPETGTLDGVVTTVTGGTPLPGSAITMTDALGNVFYADADASGGYNRTLPIGTYMVTASAEGYLSSTVSGVSITTDTHLTQDFSLTDLPPVAPEVDIAVNDSKIYITWEHEDRNSAYHLHRSDAPYFTPDAGNRLAVFEPPFPQVIEYEDTSAALGESSVNHFYFVLGINDDDVTASSNQVAEFDYDVSEIFTH